MHTVYKRTGSLSSIWKFHFQVSKTWCLPCLQWLLIFPLAYPVLQNDTGRGGLVGVGRQLFPASGKVLKAHGQDNVPRGHLEGCWDEGWGHITLPTPLSAVLGTQIPLRWCPELFGDSRADALLPLSNL